MGAHTCGLDRTSWDYVALESRRNILYIHNSYLNAWFSVPERVARYVLDGVTRSALDKVACSVPERVILEATLKPFNGNYKHLLGHSEAFPRLLFFVAFCIWGALVFCHSKAFQG